jgi:hypothetical protein
MMDEHLRQQLYELVADLRSSRQHLYAARLLMVMDQSDRRAQDATKRRCDELLARAAIARVVGAA